MVVINKREYNSERRRKLDKFITTPSQIIKSDKREYNSERRRKLYSSFYYIFNFFFKIRENITPRGDGNLFVLNSIPF